MASSSLLLIGVVSIFLYLTTSATSNSNQNLDTYIVQVEPNYDYQSFLPTDILSTSTAAITHSYENVFSGFAAKLSKADLEFVKNRNGFVSAHRERTYPLHTTHSPEFLGLFRNLGFWNGSSKYGKGVVIGLLDSGISPSHPSFHDAGMPPPPSKW
ncbi:hypothetical protein RD792_017739 [Penstemon davidsonii]|uniref:Inhibitor I9 domain-containing protein n=1 Tax=Penstemon davidsonii TaxID=160366 RepID=A0ABR0DVW3_9LAMI|nr:hypothetical protein RD792_017739 [Penstemon davidsonii]